MLKVTFRETRVKGVWLTLFSGNFSVHLKLFHSKKFIFESVGDSGELLSWGSSINIYHTRN